MGMRAICWIAFVVSGPEMGRLSHREDGGPREYMTSRVGDVGSTRAASHG